MRRPLTCLLLAALLTGVTSEARADRFKAAREAAEYLIKRFGRKAVSEGADQLSRRIASAAARHGDGVISAVRKVGPKAITLADDAGEHAPQVLRLLSRHGDDAARVLARPVGLALVSRYGDEAAEALMKHPGVAEPLLRAQGSAAVRALCRVDPQNGRRLAMLTQGGAFARIGHEAELLDVIARHGDKACDFIWRNKGALATASVLTAFLADPAPFLDGTKELASTAISETTQVAGHLAAQAAAPVASATGHVIEETGHALVWPLVLLALLGGLVVIGSWLAQMREARKGPQA